MLRKSNPESNHNDTYPDDEVSKNHTMVHSDSNRDNASPDNEESKSNTMVNSESNHNDTYPENEDNEIHSRSNRDESITNSNYSATNRSEKISVSHESVAENYSESNKNSSGTDLYSEISFSSTNNLIKHGKNKNISPTPMSTFKPQRPIGINKIQTAEPIPEKIALLSPTSIPKPMSKNKGFSRAQSKIPSTTSNAGNNPTDSADLHVSKPKGSAKETPRSSQKVAKQDQSESKSEDSSNQENYPSTEFKKKESSAPRNWNKKSKKQKSSNGSEAPKTQNEYGSIEADMFKDSGSLKEPSLLGSSEPK